MLDDFLHKSPSHQLIDEIVKLVNDDSYNGASVSFYDAIIGNNNPGDKEVHIGIDLLTWVVIWTDLTLEDALKFRITRTENEQVVLNVELDEPACKKFGVDKILEVARIKLKEQDD